MENRIFLDNCIDDTFLDKENIRWIIYLTNVSDNDEDDSDVGEYVGENNNRVTQIYLPLNLSPPWNIWTSKWQRHCMNIVDRLAEQIAHCLCNSPTEEKLLLYGNRSTCLAALFVYLSREYMEDSVRIEEAMYIHEPQWTLLGHCFPFYFTYCVLLPFIAKNTFQ